LQSVAGPLPGGPCRLVVLSAITLSALHVGRAGGTVVLRQLGWFGVGLIAMVIVASIDYRKLVRIAPGMYVLGLAGLVGVFALGRSVSGARRWIVLGPLSAQPAELLKLAFLLTVVWLLVSRCAQPIKIGSAHV